MPIKGLILIMYIWIKLKTPLTIYFKDISNENLNKNQIKRKLKKIRIYELISWKRIEACGI